VRSGPLDVPIALRIGRATLRKTHQTPGSAIGYNTLAFPNRGRGPSGSCCARRSPAGRCPDSACSSQSTRCCSNGRTCPNHRPRQTRRRRSRTQHRGLPPPLRQRAPGDGSTAG
jgi:hypothetical protein